MEKIKYPKLRTNLGWICLILNLKRRSNSELLQDFCDLKSSKANLKLGWKLGYFIFSAALKHS